MIVALLTTDNREHCREYHKAEPWFGTAPAALLQGMARLPELQVHVVSCAQQPMRSPAKLADNISFHSLHVPKLGWLRTGYQGCIRAVRRKLRELRPDVVHGQGTERECAISAVLSGFPNVLTVHGNMRVVARVNHARPLTYLWLAAQLERFTLPRAGGVVCISNHTLAEVTPLARRTWYVPNAVDSAFFDVQAAPVTPPTILCVGQVCRHKNQSELIRALDPLAATLPFRVLFLGGAARSDAYGAEFLDLVAARPWCSHGGFVEREKLRSHLGEASLLALPSLEDNCPMAVLEAMAAGVPVVAARVGGVPDLVQAGETGLLYKPGDVEGLRQSVATLLQQPDLARRLATRAREWTLNSNHPDHIASFHLEIYRDLLSTAS